MNTNDKLRDKHAEALSDLRNGVEMDAAHDPQGADKLAALDYAIAALSALPAVGGGDEVARVAAHIRMSVEYIEKVYPGTRTLDAAPILRNMRRWAARLEPTTPQPSAAEGGEERARKLYEPDEYEDAFKGREDAAVGAQGDGEAAARAAFEQQAKGWRNAIPWDELHDDTRKLWRDFVARRAAAAPAAGKGVDDALVRDLLPKGWTFDCQGKQDYDTELVSLSCRYYPGNYSRDGSHSVTASIIFGEGQQTISTRDFSAASEAEVKTLAEEWARQQVALLVAVLTRQPVAGDGWRLRRINGGQDDA